MKYKKLMTAVMILQVILLIYNIYYIFHQGSLIHGITLVFVNSFFLGANFMWFYKELQ